MNIFIGIIALISGYLSGIKPLLQYLKCNEFISGNITGLTVNQPENNTKVNNYNNSYKKASFFNRRQPIQEQAYNKKHNIISTTNINYKYVVNGREYLGQTIGISFKHHIIGELCDIKYSQESPQISYMVGGGMIYVYKLGTLLFVIGIVILLFGIFGIINSANISPKFLV